MRTHELGGAVKEGEAQRLNRLEHMEDGAFPRGCPAHRARLDLKVREQVMREDHQVLPCAVGRVRHGRYRVEGEPALELGR